MSTKQNGAHSLPSTQPPWQHSAVSEERPVPWGAWQMISDATLTPPHLVKKGTPMCAAPMTDEEHTRAPSCAHFFLHGDAGQRNLSRLRPSTNCCALHAVAELYTTISWTSRSSTLWTMILQHTAQDFKKKNNFKKAIRPLIFPLSSTLNCCTITQINIIVHKIRFRMRKQSNCVRLCTVFSHCLNDNKPQP